MIVINEMKADPLAKEFFRDDEIFADLVNGLLFNGKEIVSESSVRDGDTDSSSSLNEKSIERRGDITKIVTVKDKEFVVRVENQQKPDRSMPIRNGEYTMLYYDRLIKEKKKLVPVYTLTLYYGEREWRFPRKISHMVNMPYDMEEPLQDWDARVIDLKHVDYRLFRNEELRTFIIILQRLYRFKSIESLSDLHPTRRVALLAAVVTGSEELKENIRNQEGERIDMCKAIDEFVKEKVAIGMQQGEDRATVNSIQNLTKNLGITIEEAMKLLGITEQKRERYLVLL